MTGQRRRGVEDYQGYLPYAQRPNALVVFGIRTAADPDNAIAEVRAAIASVDPVLPTYDIDCAVLGEIVTFDKEAAVVPGGPRRRVYGAVRFLTGRYSAFQLIRAGGAISPETLNEMQAVVASWRPLD